MSRIDTHFVADGARRFTMTTIERFDRHRSTPVLLRVVVKNGSTPADSYANLSVLNDRGWIAVVTHAFDQTPIGGRLTAESEIRNWDDDTYAALATTLDELFDIGRKMYE